LDKKITINDFIKECKKLFGNDIEYKATSKDGQVFKTKGWRDDKVGINQRQFTNVSREVKNT
jgi:hypothetical protein